MPHVTPFVGLVTGQIGVGKTTVCRQVVQVARARGCRVGGFLTPAIHDQEGHKVGIALLDLSTGEQRPLGHLDQGQPGLRVGKYKFDPQVLRWGCKLLERAAEGGYQLFVVDEVGPLEVERGQGFVRALTLLEQGVLPCMLVVVRESLLEALRGHAAGARVVDFRVTQGNRAQIWQDIADQVCPD